jgi:hypothetical protein
MNSSALRHEMYRHLFKNISKVDTTDLFASFQKRPSTHSCPSWRPDYGPPRDSSRHCENGSTLARIHRGRAPNLHDG